MRIHTTSLLLRELGVSSCHALIVGLAGGLSVRPRGVASSESSLALKMNASLVSLVYPKQANDDIRKLEDANKALIEKVARLEDPAGDILKKRAQPPQPPPF